MARPLPDALATALRDTESLLLVDNFEHVVEATPLLTHLLAHCPRLRLLVTSRTLLQVAGEYAFPVSPLAVPDPEGGSSIEDVAGSPAVQLFAERASAVDPAFALTESTAPSVVDICRRLDGLPLAIELAAARLTHLSLPTLRERLERRLPLLTGGGSRPDRHRTLRDAISWSYDLLNEEEQDLLCRLAVFAGGFTLEAAEVVNREARRETRDVRRENEELAHVSRLASHVSTLDVIASLVDKSLVSLSGRHPRAPSGNGTRYTMLETIREFAAERLAASGEDVPPRRAHAAYFLTFAEQHAVVPFLPDDGRRLAELAAEDANLRAALTWLAAHGEGFGPGATGRRAGLVLVGAGPPRGRGSLV